MMSVKYIVGSLVITSLPHLGDIMSSGGGLSGRVCFQRGYPAKFYLVDNFDLEIILLFYVC